jgi:hypothetical protein
MGWSWSGLRRNVFLACGLAILSVFTWSGICSGLLAQEGSGQTPPAGQGNSQPDQPQSNQSQQDQSPSNQPPQNQSPPDPSHPDQTHPDQSQQDQTSPPEKKDESPNPAQAAAEKTKEVTMQAAEQTKKAGQAALVKARDWETGWFTGAYVGKNRKLVPLTPQERKDIYLQQTLTEPSDYFKRMFAAGIDQARGAPRQWQGGIGGYGERFASREGQFIAANSLTALANAKLHYEPRYDQCRCTGFKLRTRHAILRNFFTYNESETELRPQWGLYSGAFGGGLISTAWKPHPRNAFAEGGRAMAGQAGYGVLLNFFIEFAGDINRKLGSRK